VTLLTRGQRRDREVPKVEVKIAEKTLVVFGNVGLDGARPTEGFVADVWFEEGSQDTARKIGYRGNAAAERRGDRAADMQGRVVAVAKDGKSITVEAPARRRGEEPEQTVVKLPPKSGIVFHNVGPGGAKITEDLYVRAWLKEGCRDSADKMTFLGRVKERDTVVAGKVVVVSKDGKSITLQLPPPGRSEEVLLVVKITDRTRIGYTGVGPGEAKPTEGYRAHVLLKEGTKDTAAGVMFGKAGRDGRR
jgi:hypothetical protein